MKEKDKRKRPRRKKEEERRETGGKERTTPTLTNKHKARDKKMKSQRVRKLI